MWWLGATKGIVRAALLELGAVAVTLDSAAVDWLLPDDLDEIPDVESWTALLPPLDPTVMGWKGRDFYLGPHKGSLLDSRGNAGATAWVDGHTRPLLGRWLDRGRLPAGLPRHEWVARAGPRRCSPTVQRTRCSEGAIRAHTSERSGIMQNPRTASLRLGAPGSCSATSR